MATINSSSLAAANAVGVTNTQFTPSVSILQRKILMIGQYLTGKSPSENTPIQVLNPSDTADRTGFGGPLHRLHLWVDKIGSNVPVYIIAQEEEAAAVAATGTIVATVTTVEAGTLYLYVSGELVEVTLTDGMSATEVGDAIEAAINDDVTLAVTASNASGTVTLTAKAKGTYGNYIQLSTNEGTGQTTPEGVTLVLTDLSGGAADPDLDDALTGTDVNQEWFTDVTPCL